MCDMYEFFRELMLEHVTTSGKRRPCTKYYTIKNLYNKQDGVAYTVVLYSQIPAFCRVLPRYALICKASRAAAVAITFFKRANCQAKCNNFE